MPAGSCHEHKAFWACSLPLISYTPTLSGCVSGDLLESEQNASMQLRKEMAELEKRVEQLQGTNNSLDKQVGLPL